MTQITELTERVKTWAAHDEIDNLVPTFVELVNADLRTVLRTRHNSKIAKLPLNVFGTDTNLPSDFLEFRQVSFGGCSIPFVTPDQIAAVCGNPCTRVYSVVADKVRVAPQVPWPGECVPYPVLQVALTIEFDPSMNEDVYTYHFDLMRDGAIFPEDFVLHFEYVDAGFDTKETFTGSSGVCTVVKTYSSVSPPSDTVSAYAVLASGVSTNTLTIKERTPAISTPADITCEMSDDPIPELAVVYYHALPPLGGTDTGGTPAEENLFYSKFPNVYLYGVLEKTFHYLFDESRATTWGSHYTEAVRQILDDDSGFSAGPLQIRST